MASPACRYTSLDCNQQSCIWRIDVGTHRRRPSCAQEAARDREIPVLPRTGLVVAMCRRPWSSSGAHLSVTSRARSKVMLPF